MCTKKDRQTGECWAGKNPTHSPQSFHLKLPTHPAGEWPSQRQRWKRFHLLTRLNNSCSSLRGWELCGEAGVLSFSVLWVNYSFHFSLQQRIWTRSKIHQLPVYVLQLPQLGILIGSDTHMCFVSGRSCIFMYMCRPGVRFHVAQSTWLGLWQTLSRWRSISIRGQLYSSTPAAHYSPQQPSAARDGQVHKLPLPSFRILAQGSRESRRWRIDTNGKGWQSQRDRQGGSARVTGEETDESRGRDKIDRKGMTETKTSPGLHFDVGLV